MISTEAEALRKKQYEILGGLYDLMGKVDKDPNDSFLKLDLDLAQKAYDQTVADLQKLHPDGENCPAWFCDTDLASTYSDAYKAAYGFRYRGNMSVKAMKDSMPYLVEAMGRNEDLDRQIEQRMAEQDAADLKAKNEARELSQAYNIQYDHFDPRLAA